MMRMSAVLLVLLLLCSQCRGESEGTHASGQGTGGEGGGLVGNSCLVVSLLDRMHALEGTMSALKEQLEVERQRAAVGFSASLGIHGNLGPFSTDTILAYKRVLTNTGDAYNPSTGIFTAPVRGLYYFSFSGHHQTSKSMGFSLYKNEEKMVSLHNHAAGNRFESTSQGVNLLLEKGDQVYIKLWENTWVHDNTDFNVNIFTGHLVVPM
ncbi:complement C1q-like protein 2 [Engraulis encrasicolus]|uniref:complement C1q-like protein 2 n=1 Tax=Engraulis encrasicolus TaxID=184585 RepID=UPI002FD61735